MSHTKGQWTVLDHYEPGRILINSGAYPNSTPVAEIISSGDTKRANARLIAAAPEILEALELVQNYIIIPGDPKSVELQEYVVELIKKARGESNEDL